MPGRDSRRQAKSRLKEPASSWTGCSGNAFRERSTQSQASRPCTLNWTLLQDAFLAAQGIQEPVGRSTRQRQHSRHAACGGELSRYAWISASKQLCEVQRAGASRLKTTVGTSPGSKTTTSRNCEQSSSATMAHHPVPKHGWYTDENCTSSATMAFRPVPKLSPHVSVSNSRSVTVAHRPAPKPTNQNQSIAVVQ